LIQLIDVIELPSALLPHESSMRPGPTSPPQPIHMALLACRMPITQAAYVVALSGLLLSPLWSWYNR